MYSTRAFNAVRAFVTALYESHEPQGSSAGPQHTARQQGPAPAQQVRIRNELLGDVGCAERPRAQHRDGALLYAAVVCWRRLLQSRRGAQQLDGGALEEVPQQPRAERRAHPRLLSAQAATLPGPLPAAHPAAHPGASVRQAGAAARGLPIGAGSAVDETGIRAKLPRGPITAAAVIGAAAAIGGGGDAGGGGGAAGVAQAVFTWVAAGVAGEGAGAELLSDRVEEPLEGAAGLREVADVAQERHQLQSRHRRAGCDVFRSLDVLRALQRVTRGM